MISEHNMGLALVVSRHFLPPSLIQHLRDIFLTNTRPQFASATLMRPYGTRILLFQTGMPHY